MMGSVNPRKRAVILMKERMSFSVYEMTFEGKEIL
jgi:hypothetical protein